VRKAQKKFWAFLFSETNEMFAHHRINYFTKTRSNTNGSSAIQIKNILFRKIIQVHFKILPTFQIQFQSK